MRGQIPELLVEAEVRKAEEILQVVSLPEAASPAMLAALVRALEAAGVIEALGIAITYTDMNQTWIIGVPTSDPTVMSEIWHNAQKELRLLVDSDEAVPDVALSDSRHDTLFNEFGHPLLEVTT